MSTNKDYNSDLNFDQQAVAADGGVGSGLIENDPDAVSNAQLMNADPN